jgi:hypothetical protein
MKWLELNVFLTDDTQFNQVLANFVKPFIDDKYYQLNRETWHYFREPQLCLRVGGYGGTIERSITYLDERLNKLEKIQSNIYKSHLFGAFGVKDKQYIGEEELYGTDAWELCYKRWEAGSNLALQLCTDNPTKSLPFHYTRDIHLFENQLGFDYSDAIVMYLKWTKKLMECEPDKKFTKHIEAMDNIIKDTFKYAKVNGI